MNTVTIIELKRPGWRQEVVESSFVIFRKPLNVGWIKPKELLKKAVPNRKRRCFVGEYLFL